MPESVRKSRADRRRAAVSPTEPERRSSASSLVPVLRSVVRSNQITIYVQSEIVADNFTASKAAILHHCSRASPSIIVLDLERCGYIDTTGLSALMEVKKSVEGEGRTLIIENPSRGVLRLVNLTRMHRFFEIRFSSQNLERIPGAGSASPQGQAGARVQENAG